MVGVITDRSQTHAQVTSRPSVEAIVSSPSKGRGFRAGRTDDLVSPGSVGCGIIEQTRYRGTRGGDRENDCGGRPLRAVRPGGLIRPFVE